MYIQGLGTYLYSSVLFFSFIQNCNLWLEDSRKELRAGVITYFGLKMWVHIYEVRSHGINY